MRVNTLPLQPGPAVLAAVPALMAALDGSGPPLAPYAAGSTPPSLPAIDAAELPDGLALIASTSGSTGVPKRVLLTADNLLSSAGAAHEVLGGPGDWLLAVPPHHIAGLAVIIRAALASGEPTVMDSSGGFTPASFAAAAASMPGTGDPTYVSLVPTQVTRLLADPLGRETLAAFDAVLCGGAMAPAGMRETAAEHGIRLITTFGTTETSGGCVYDGMPLPVSHVHIDNDRHVTLGGATIAHGYLTPTGVSEDGFYTDADGVRWFRTEDLGAFDDVGRLLVTARADELINSGGVKVAPGPVEDALMRFLPGVRDAVVVGVPDPEWGEVVAAAVTVLPRTDPPPTLADARALLRGVVPDAALPRLLQVVERLPLKGPGKPDRLTIAAWFASGAS